MWRIIYYWYLFKCFNWYVFVIYSNIKNRVEMRIMNKNVKYVIIISNKY